jgi:hypothetical protein
MVLLVDLPKHPRPLPRLGLVTALFAILMLSRYTGVIIFAAIGLWWVWWRVYQQRVRRLVVELPIMALAGVPFALWLARNILLAEEVAGRHFTQSTTSFLEGIVPVMWQMHTLLLPAIRPLYEIRDAGASFGAFTGLLTFLHVVIVLPLLLLLAMRLWRQHQRDQPGYTPPRSPILLALAAYLALYTVAQPVLSFTPLDPRDTTTMLVLIQPWLFAALAQVFPRRALTVATGYVGLNLLLLLLVVGTQALPGVLTLSSPGVADLSDEPDLADDYRQRAVPEWLLVEPFRVTTLPHHHADLLEQIDAIEGDVVIESNVDNILFYTQAEPQPPVRTVDGFQWRSLPAWYAEGSCTPAHNTLVILFDWDYLRPLFESSVAGVERKCPDAPRETFNHGVIYRLGPWAAPPGPQESRAGCDQP